MELKIDTNEVAETIAARVEGMTGKGCEVFTNAIGESVICHLTTVIARITPVYGCVYVIPFGGTFDGEVASVPLEAETLGSLREIPNALDKATSYVTSAVMHH